MFRVHENGDGSTSIFCSKTGKLICTIRNQQKNMGLGCRPVNVVEPSPKPRSCCFNLDLKNECLPNEDDDNQNSKEERCDSPAWNEPKEDFSHDCITSEQFARCLNLVSTEEFKNEPIEQLRSTFPLRHLSRLKALVKDSQDLKVPEELPISSSLGLKILNLNKQKNYYCDQTVETKIKGYDSFCRIQIDSDVFGHFPKLRCREKKDYPVCVPSKISRYSPAHTYAFNKRQRLENLITIRTGLDTQSRKLLLRCNKRLAVSIKRMPDNEMQYWMQKRAKFGPIPEDLIKGEEPSSCSDSLPAVIRHDNPTYIDLCSDESSSEKDDKDDKDDPSYRCKVSKEISFQGVLNKCKGTVSPLRNRNGQYPTQLQDTFGMYKDCCVILQDVLFHTMQKCNNDYYVTGTNIKVPFLQDYINTLDSKTRNNLVFPITQLVTNPRYDHAYHRPFSQYASPKKLLSNSNCLNLKNSKNDSKKKLKVNNCVKDKSSLPVKINHVTNCNSLSSNASITLPDLKIIPVIDLTCSHEDKAGSFWIFHCYGCGYKNTSRQESDAYSIASKHMKNFHCVSDPMSFLNVYNTQSGGVLEAFPGYKNNPLK